MASQAETNRKRLREELAKPLPDPDVVYYLQTTRPYWNTVDTDAMRRGSGKLYGDSLQKTHDKLAQFNKGDK